MMMIMMIEIYTSDVATAMAMITDRDIDGWVTVMVTVIICDSGNRVKPLGKRVRQ